MAGKGKREEMGGKGMKMRKRETSTLTSKPTRLNLIKKCMNVLNSQLAAAGSATTKRRQWTWNFHRQAAGKSANKKRNFIYSDTRKVLSTSGQKLHSLRFWCSAWGKNRRTNALSGDRLRNLLRWWPVVLLRWQTHRIGFIKALISFGYSMINFSWVPPSFCTAKDMRRKYREMNVN